MRKFLKNLASLFLIPVTRWYLRKERKYQYGEISISVLPGVFHPGLFSSTKFILQYLEKQNLANKTLLEVGSGTGLISIVAANAGATVTALDLSRTAIENTIMNAHANNANIEILKSDVFASMKEYSFDWIVINPPYYARDPENENDLAWYCGENFEYFRKLFKRLPLFLHPKSNVVMVLTKTSELQTIVSLGGESGFDFVLLNEKEAFFDEKDFLYSLRLKASYKEVV